MFRTLFIILLASVSVACSTQPQKQRLPSMDSLFAELTEQDGRACIRSSSANGFSAIDDNLVSISGHRKKHYLVTTLFSCHSLDFSMGVALVGTFSEVCGGRAGDALVTREESCPIKHIYAFESRDDAMTVVKMAEGKREALRQFPAAPQPEPEPPES